MQPPDLSDQQRTFVLSNGNLFAEACPGAGKTRAIVARYLRRTEDEPRKGIGLLSFTTAAIEVATARCGSRTDALRAPHFIGTFDGLINRFITRPLYVQQYNRAPRFMETWQGVTRASFRITGMDRLPPLHLDWFSFDPTHRATLEDGRMPSKAQRILAPFLSERRSDVEAVATKRCRGLISVGLLSCTASRALAARYLSQTPKRELLGTLLAARFSEVIVDEMQDCGPEELLVLELLLEYGVTVVMVADMDQSIFEFRRAEPTAVRIFTDRLGTPLRLDGNYRSSPAICALNNSLRHGDQEEVACGQQAACLTPVQLLGFRNFGQVATIIEARLTYHKLSRSDIMVLSHVESHAKQCAGAPATTDEIYRNAVLRIAQAGAVLRDVGSSGRDRLRAVRAIEDTLRIIAQVADDTAFSLDERWLRDTAVRLAVTLDPAGTTPKGYAAAVRQYIRQITWPSGISPLTDLGTMLRAPSHEDWPEHTAPSPETLRAATIHSVKGREFPAVVVVLPKKLRTDANGQDLLDHWENGTQSEMRRVLYVGASRAQQLLILAVHANHVDRVATLLKLHNVPHELI